MTRRYSVLMVCMGNICRSPTAEGVLRDQVQRAGLQGQVLIDSAGTHDYHIGSAPDERSCGHALRRGYDLSPLRARQVCTEDFARFDLVLAMDSDNLALLEQVCPPAHRHKLQRLMAFAPASWGDQVGDPYYGGADGFERVLNQVEQACAGLIQHLRGELGTSA